MTALPGQVAHDLRAWAKFYNGRLRATDGWKIDHMNRAATAIEAAMVQPPDKRDRIELEYLTKSLREAATAVDQWQFVFGATQLATSLWRAAACLDRLLSEAGGDD